MASLGELLFYIMIQANHGEEQSVWAVPDTTIQAVASLLALGEETITQVGRCLPWSLFILMQWRAYR